MLLTEIRLETSSTSCFHGNGAVQLESGPARRFADVKVGDRILTCNTCDSREDFSFSEVTKLPHATNNEPATFLTLTIGEKTVDMTHDHHIPRCDGRVVAASELVLGDCLLTIDGKETLLEVTPSSKTGVYTAIPKENNYIVVNGIVASPYSKIISADKASYSEEDFKKNSAELDIWKRAQLYATHKAKKMAKARLLRSAN
jgi:hypothetical protein